MSKEAQDNRFMAAAIRLAERHIGLTGENPSVGALIVKNSETDASIVGYGVTAVQGRPHAEVQALLMAGSLAHGATAYITLEPCSHYGKAPPCVNALISAGIARVVIALSDPDQRVYGRGIALLRAAGIEVVEGVLAEEAFETLSAYLCVKKLQRCEVTLKMAISADNGVGKKGQNNVEISGEISRAQTHILRAQNDVIMVGIGTILADDPQLDCRLPGLEMRSPIRVILDKNLCIPLDAKVVQTAANIPTWVICGTVLSKRRKKIILEQYGVTVYSVEEANNNLIPPLTILKLLYQRKINSVLLEGGAKTGEIFLSSGCVDRLICFYAPIILGEDRIKAPYFESYLSEFNEIEMRMLGNDCLYKWRRKILCSRGS
ncbi:MULTISPECIES: bifunctional diaminohydroxyphosphoribosylaminopyrimidine deaminase/5-amino-6-(5-phosphoribosylamino)uracil reductase RibD [unclassified Bartonella]|uniref:bifunctional diaminohydroxyphosphoribosylaminopyrimidine deaminase/5-amino-6-(5-phosphoribosylamino)uracil reductase RibD n=1 Tax=unclassified Bartonella TaxID=2645622 RepID=UPI00099AC3B3|nr:MULTISPECIES: bifunctional diaminohydroxyphosphoribosylaminopyrimidine deaminase/5-amino-6-(5-phosphoribosylamino)uracil reductase RibD [unclassified Bartonella]AQX28080.1 diaminohydroxyphosphoribosylaminopyrimidine deaminase [Bartonella sp. JB15]AQX29353.1 diaminohydroxyphosphoribosylaminopyrimidine deaminase [Bartonella sp. JB63]